MTFGPCEFRAGLAAVLRLEDLALGAQSHFFYPPQCHWLRHPCLRYQTNSQCVKHLEHRREFRFGVAAEGAIEIFAR